MKCPKCSYDISPAERRDYIKKLGFGLKQLRPRMRCPRCETQLETKVKPVAYAFNVLLVLLSYFLALNSLQTMGTDRLAMLAACLSIVMMASGFVFLNRKFMFFQPVDKPLLSKGQAALNRLLVIAWFGVLLAGPLHIQQQAGWATELLSQAEHYAERGEYDQAIFVLKELDRKYPRLKHPALIIASFQKAMGRDEQVDYYCRQAATISELKSTPLFQSTCVDGTVG